MIISRTSFRLSFLGGATDIENYYSQYNGEVVSCSINKYIYITISKRDDNKIILVYNKIQEEVTWDTLDKTKNAHIKECLKYLGCDKERSGVEIHSIADLSTIGTGLGGSSAFVVGLLNAWYKYLGQDYPPEFIAEQACQVEIKLMGKSIGKQDQYACAIGGLNHLKFNKDGTVNYQPLNDKVFRGRLYLFPYQLETRLEANNLLDFQNKRYKENLPVLHQIKDQCQPFIKAINHRKPDFIVSEINKYWELKKKLSPLISHSNLDSLIGDLQGQGYGVKLCGAGQSGFLLVFSPTGHHPEGCIPVSVSEKGTVCWKI